MVLVRDATSRGPWLNLYAKTDVVRIVDLFEHARQEGRLLQFLLRGPDEEDAAGEVLGVLNRDKAPVIDEAVWGMWHWQEGRIRHKSKGVRWSVVRQERGVEVDTSAISKSIRSGRGNDQPITLD